MARYNGFSTYNRSKHFRLTDFDLVKQDLINHFNTRKGEKLMNPNFGTSIWDTLFDPMDADTKRIITEDVRRIVSYDPRIAARNVVVTEYDRGHLVFCHHNARAKTLSTCLINAPHLNDGAFEVIDEFSWNLRVYIFRYQQKAEHQKFNSVVHFVRLKV